MMKDTSVFSRMSSLRRLDLRDHPEFFMCEERKEALEYQALHGINPDQKKDVKFVDQGSTIQQLIPHLQSVEELRCDGDLEIHIINTRKSKPDYMPKLRTLNGVSFDTIPLEDQVIRQSHRRVGLLFEKLKYYLGSYAVQQGPLSVPVWFLQDEVGSAIGHSDSPNVRVAPFMYSPANSASDPAAISFNVMWPVKDMAANDAIYRDFLFGFGEQQFRSARLHAWFDTPSVYYERSLAALRAKTYLNVEAEHLRI